MDIEPCKPGRSLLTRQAGRFLLAGAARTGFSLVLYWAFNLVLPYRIAFTISFVSTVMLSAIVSSRFVFIVRITGLRFAAYTIAYVVHYLLSLQLLVFAVEGLGLPSVYAPFLVIPIMIPIGFFLERFSLTASKKQR
jgi:putative flippase GtrA